jgi:F-type H+-transporting ATPase subunit b
MTGSLIFAAAAAGGSSSSSSSSSGGSFLISPNVGLMVWTLLLFALSMAVLAKWVFPRIRDNLDKRTRAIEESIDQAEEIRRRADQLLNEYRERLAEARQQGQEIIDRARKAGEAHERGSEEEAIKRREALMERTRREIEAETRRAIQEIRREVADLTVLATEKVTRKTLTDEDQQRLVEEALSELDFGALAPSGQEG